MLVWTDQLRPAGVSSTRPVGLVARTRNVWLPFASAEYVVGDAHGAYAAPSRLQPKVEPATEAENVSVAEVKLPAPDGPEPMVVSGGVSPMELWK